MALKEWFSVQELVGLPGMPGTVRGVRFNVQKNLLLSRSKERGKGLEYALKSLPPETQAHLAAQVVAMVLACLPESLKQHHPETAAVVVQGMALAVPAPEMDGRAALAMTGAGSALTTAGPAPLPTSFYQTNAQRAVSDARTTVLRFVARLEAESGASTRQAMLTFLTTAAAGRLTGDIGAAVLALSRDSRGRKADNAHASAAGLPTLRTLQGWLVRQGELLAGENLAPRLPLATQVLAPWMVLAVELKRRPQKPTTRQVLEQLHSAWADYSLAWVRKNRVARLGKPCTPGQLEALAAQLAVPSYDQLSRFFRTQFSSGDLLVGQHGGSALRAHQFYQHRTNAGLEPFVEVHADGWNTHFLAPHPISGEYVSFEVWHFHDVATRYTTPFSIGMSESADVILSGLEQCIRVGGVPAIWQTDSTGSVKNARVEFDPVTSLSARVGMTVVHPQTVGNSQANGIAENFNTRLDRESRALATYMHPQRMDSLAFKQVRKFTGAMVKAAAKGDLDAHKVARAAALRVGKGLLFETKAQMVAWLDEIRVKANNAPHSALRKITDATGKVRHQSPQEALDAAIKGGWVPYAVDEATMNEFFRMHTRKTVRRETVTTIKEQRYYHPALTAFEGQEVVVSCDTMDGERVWVKTPKGALICEALYVAATGYRALSSYEWALEKRMDAQIKRKENQIEDIKARMDPERAPLEVRAIDVSEANAAHAQVYAFAPLPVQLPKRGAAHRELTLAERVYGAAVDAEDAAQAAAPVAVETYDERMLRQLEEREAAEAEQALAQAAQAGDVPRLETFEERMLRLVDEQDARDEREKAARLAG